MWRRVNQGIAPAVGDINKKNNIIIIINYCYRCMIVGELFVVVVYMVLFESGTALPRLERAQDLQEEEKSRPFASARA